MLKHRHQFFEVGESGTGDVPGVAPWPNPEMWLRGAAERGAGRVGLDRIPQIPSSRLTVQFQMIGRSFQPDFGRAFKYQFDVQLESLSMVIPFPCFIEVSWHRKGKSIQTKQKFEVKGHEKTFVFNEKLSMISTCYFNANNLSFKDKNSTLGIVIYIKGVPNAGGQVNVNLTTILNPTNYRQVHSKAYSVSLDKCPIKNSQLTFTLQGSYLQEMVAEEQPSMTLNSDISSLCAKSFNDSNFSLNFYKNQPPSKDSSCIKDMSNMLRFEEQTSKKRSDSVSCYGPTSNSISEQHYFDSKKKSEKSCNVSEYMLPPKKSDKIREEKYKLEAENTQLKLFVEEQGQRMDQQVKEISELKSLASSREGELANLKSEASMLRRQMDQKETLDTQLRQRMGDMSSLERQIQELQQELSGVKEDYDRSRMDAQISKQELDETLKRMFIIEREYNTTKQQKEEMLYRLKEKDTLAANNKAELERIHNEKQDFTRQRLFLEGRVRDLEGEINILNLERNKERNTSMDWNNTFKRMEETIKSLETDVAEKESRIQDLEEASREVRNNMESLQMTRANLERQLEHVSYELKNRSQNVDYLMNVKTKQELELGILRKKLEECDGNQQSVEALARDGARLEEELKTSKHNEVKATDLVGHLKDQLLNLQQSHTTKSKEAQLAKMQVLRLQSQARELQSHNRQLQISVKQNAPLLEDSSKQQKVIQELQHKMELFFSQRQSIQQGYDTLLETNIQMQIQLNLLKASHSEDKKQSNEVEEVRRQLIIERSNFEEAEEQAHSLEQQLKQKTRHLAIQVQKSKMFREEAAILRDTVIEKATQWDIERQKSQLLESNIKNVEEKNEELVRRHQEMVRKNEQLKDSVIELESVVDSTRREGKNWKGLEDRVRELESRETEQLRILEDLNSNLFKSNSVIKELNKSLEEHQIQLQSREEMIRELESKLVSNQDLRKKNNQILSLHSQKRNSDKRNELLMRELCQVKQQLQIHGSNEREAQSHAEMQQKVQSMQSQLSKKEDKMRRLQRENSKLEEENIQLNIKIMKELTQLHKKQEGIKVEYSKTLNKVLSESNI